MQNPYADFTNFILNLFQPLYDFFSPLGIPFGAMAWFYIISITPLVLIVLFLVIRGRKSGGGSANVIEAIQKVIASTGDVSGGMAGAKKLKYLKKPGDALVFLKVEENAIQQAMSAIDYYAQQGEINEAMKDQLVATYQVRLEAVRTAIAKDEELKEIVAVDEGIDRARSDYLRKLAAMSGTEVETDTEAAGPSSVGMPTATSTGPAATSAAVTPSSGPPGGAVPSGGPPSSGPPGGVTPSGGPPSGGPPGGARPGSGPPGGGPPGGGMPSGGAPGGVPPGGSVPSGGPPGGAAPGGVPGGAAPGGSAPGGGPPGGMPVNTPVGGSPSGAPSSGGKSSLQSEMLAEMERLKALMSGD